MESTLDFSTLLFRVVGSLALVLAALLAVWYLCKKTGRLPAQELAGMGSGWWPGRRSDRAIS